MSAGYAESRHDGGRPVGTGGKEMLAGSRAAENERRNSAARARAARALRWAHPETFAEFFAAARAEIDAERGPLPAEGPA